MDARTADLLVFVAVNTVALSQAAGFVTRVRNPEVNRRLGWLIIAASIPAMAGAYVSYSIGRPSWMWLAPLTLPVFDVVEIWVDYWPRVEFRNPRRPEILVPYLVLFYGSVFALGVTLYPDAKTLWAITAVSAAVLLGATVYAQKKGVG